MNKITTIIFFLIMPAPFLGFEVKPKQTNKIAIYYVIFNPECDGRAAEKYFYKLVDKKDKTLAVIDMANMVHEKYPLPKTSFSNSSDLEYGPSATNMAIVKFDAGMSNCKHIEFAICFGKSQEEALNKALKIKDDWGGKTTSYQILEQVSL